MGPSPPQSKIHEYFDDGTLSTKSLNDEETSSTNIETLPKILASSRSNSEATICQTMQSRNTKDCCQNSSPCSSSRATCNSSQNNCDRLSQSNSTTNRQIPPRRLPQLNDQSTFVRSLTTTRSSIPYVTIEPVTFLSVLALFIEFPSLQDLLYTKICLQYFPEPDSDDIKMNPSINYTSISAFTRQSRHQLNTNDSTNYQLLMYNNARNDDNYETLVSRIRICDQSDKTSLNQNIRIQIEIEQQTCWLIFQITIGFLCALTAPFWGGVSDKIGRLLPLNLAILSAILANGVYLIAGVLICIDKHELFPMGCFYITAVLIGLSGGQAVVLVNSFGFISDITSNESRSKRIVVLETIQNIAHTCGWLLSRIVTTLPIFIKKGSSSFYKNRHIEAFSLSMTLNILAILYSIISLRHHKFHRFLNNFEREQQAAATQNSPIDTISESITRTHDVNSEQTTNSRVFRVSYHGEARMRSLQSNGQNDLDSSLEALEPHRPCWKSVWTFEHYRQTFVTLTKSRDSRCTILLLILCGFISYTYLTITLSLLYIYLTASPFKFETASYSIWNMINSILQGATLIGLSISMKLIKRWDLPDPLIGSLGFLSKALGLLAIGLAKTDKMIYWISLILIFSELTMPPIRSLLSKLVVKDEIGKVFACLSALTSICIVSSNVIFYVAWKSLRQENFYRLIFIGVASLHFGCFVIMLYIHNQLRNRAFIL